MSNDFLSLQDNKIVCFEHVSAIGELNQGCQSMCSQAPCVSELLLQGQHLLLWQSKSLFFNHDQYRDHSVDAMWIL